MCQRRGKQKVENETELVVWGPCVLCASSTQKISIPLLQMALDTCRLICKWSLPWLQGKVAKIVVADPGQPSLSPEKLGTHAGSILVHKGKCSVFIYLLSRNHITLGCNEQKPNLKWVIQKSLTFCYTQYPEGKEALFCHSLPQKSHACLSLYLGGSICPPVNSGQDDGLCRLASPSFFVMGWELPNLFKPYKLRVGEGGGSPEGNLDGGTRRIWRRLKPKCPPQIASCPSHILTLMSNEKSDLHQR